MRISVLVVSDSTSGPLGLCQASARAPPDFCEAPSRSLSPTLQASARRLFRRPPGILQVSSRCLLGVFVSIWSVYCNMQLSIASGPHAVLHEALVCFIEHYTLFHVQVHTDRTRTLKVLYKMCIGIHVACDSHAQLLCMVR